MIKRKELLLIIVTALASISSAGDQQADPAAAPSTPPEATAGTVVKEVKGLKEAPEQGCIADAAAIEDLKQRREEIDLKQRELAAKETELKAREKALDDEIKRLEQIRDDIAKTDTARKKENEEKVTKLVETFETMSPKAAAQLLANVDEALAVAAIARISTLKLAKIMNVMDPTRSSRLSELLAGVVRARRNTGSNEPAAATVSSLKGGEKNDGQSQQQRNAGDSNRTTSRSPSGAQKGKGSN